MTSIGLTKGTGDVRRVPVVTGDGAGGHRAEAEGPASFINRDALSVSGGAYMDRVELSWDSQ